MLWSRVDHEIVDQAAWVPFSNPQFLDFVSRRTGNYVYSSLVGGALLDQLWVR